MRHAEERGIMRLPRWTLLAALALPLPAGAGEVLEALDRAGDAALDLRLRYEDVEQSTLANPADASTIRSRLTLSSASWRGLSGVVEGDDVESLASANYNDTRNGHADYPVVADPEGADLNQAWLQYEAAGRARIRAGRQRINLGNERFVGASAWRQNEQTFDAVAVELLRTKGFEATYAYVDRVNRVYGPDRGLPPAAFEGSSHLLNARYAWPRAGSVTGYAYWLDLDNAPQLSSTTAGARYEGSRPLREGLTFGWGVEYARQQDAGNNPVRIDAHYAALEARLTAGRWDFVAARELLSGEPPGATPNAAFQTPLATLHKWQGWADQFLTTPAGGIDDRYAGAKARWADWNVQATWHDFSAESGGGDYGSEFDVSAGVKLAKRYDILLKLADFKGDGGFADARKFWVQVQAGF
jgi:hypothetical protein